MPPPDAPRRIVQVDAYRARYYAPMTFPAYRPLLTGELGQRIALGMLEGDTPSGLVLAEFEGDGELAVRSLYVVAGMRGNGRASALLAAVEDAARGAGKRRVSAIWMAGQPFTGAIEHLLAGRAWQAPQLRMHVIHSDLESIDRARWLTRAKLEPGFGIFPWSELTPAERGALEREQERAPIPQYVWPFASSPDFEPHSSLGVRHQGEVIGWVVNHAVDNTTVRFTCSYMRDDLQGRGRLVAAYAESINRCRAAGISKAMWTVPVQFPRMVAFSRRHLMPYATSLAETRGSYKDLG